MDKKLFFVLIMFFLIVILVLILLLVNKNNSSDSRLNAEIENYIVNNPDKVIELNITQEEFESMKRQSDCYEPECFLNIS